MSHKIAVVGATGNVGREILEILEERNFPAENIFAIASKHSKGKEVHYGQSNKKLKVESIEEFDYGSVDIALFSCGGQNSAVYAPKFAEAGVVVIDNSSYFRTFDDVPLIIPEVNIDDLKNYKKTNIIANPNCAVIQLLTALKPLHDDSKIKRIVISTYQSVSGAGRKAMDELYNQTKAKFVFEDLNNNQFPTQIAFNVIPHIDDFLENGYTKEEDKIRQETKKILSKDIELTATCVRVPTFVGHAISANVEFSDKIDAKKAKKILLECNHLTLHDKQENGGYTTPINCVKEDNVFISRLREDFSKENCLNFWIVADNLRKGAALNAVQIAEKLIELHL